ncbi:MAG: hypothetical protein K1X79_07130 [Oligoflexia bacterium]|nr:hypothetical protein [Oligoflexia bacterium]
MFSAAEGLGPVFNEVSCGSCHGHPEATSMIPLGGASIGLTQSVRRFGQVQGNIFDPLASLGGSLLQMHSAVQLPECQEVIPAQANVISARLTTPTFGAGLVEAIPDRTLLRGQANTAVSGTAQLVHALEDPAGSAPRIGRFGWKSQVATILSFSADASLNEMGITNRFLQTENAPQGNQAALAVCDTVADPEDQPSTGRPEFIDAITDFQRYLAAPPQTPKRGMRGESLFRQVGCANCHTPLFRTSKSRAVPIALRDKPIAPYSDFLLHDMGVSGDGIGQGGAGRFEMRTAPLWGLALRSFFWHDGSQPLYQVSDLDSIILGVSYPWGSVFYGHNAPGSEASASAALYGSLTPSQRSDLFTFLKSLGRPEFDLVGSDHRVDRLDIAPMRACLQVAAPIGPDDPCAVADLNADGKVGNFDKKGFALAYQGPQFDCDCNGANDILAILNGTVADSNSDGYPDVCNVGLNLTVQPGAPGQPWDSLKSGQQVQVIVTGADAGDSVYVLVSFVARAGTSSGLLPAPHQALCVNLDQAQNFASLLGAAPALQANNFGSAVLSAPLPTSAPFAAGRIRLQAFEMKSGGGYRRSPVIEREIE